MVLASSELLDLGQKKQGRTQVSLGVTLAVYSKAFGDMGQEERSLLLSVPAPCPSGLKEAKVGHNASSSQTDCSGKPGPLRMVSSLSFLFLRSAQALQPKEETWKGSSHHSSPLRVMVGEGAFRDAGRMLTFGSCRFCLLCHLHLCFPPLHTVPIGFLDWELPSSSMQTKT